MSFKGIPLPPGYKWQKVDPVVLSAKPWRKTFAILPVKTITGKWVFGKIVYKRRALIGWAMHDAYETQYATFLEILAG